MRAEVIAIGDELTSGQRIDTNSAWLAAELGILGVPAPFHVTAADTLAGGVEAFRAACDRADVVVATGGLGPTADDLTRDVLAALVGVPLEPVPEALRAVEERFVRRGMAMPEANRRQALFPRGSRMLPNPLGTAPGIDLDVPAGGRTSRVFALPGVPAEMKPMWRDCVVPALLALLPDRGTIVQRRVKCFGAGESAVEAMLPDLVRRGRDPLVGITVHEATITLRIAARGADAADCRRRIAATEEIIRDCLGGLVFGVEDDEIEDAALAAARAAGVGVASLEAGTAGGVAALLAAAQVRHGGTPAYRGGSVLTAEPAAAGELAARARDAFGAEIGLGVGQVRGGPDGRERLEMAVVGPAGARTLEHVLGGGPVAAARAAKTAVDLVRRFLTPALAVAGGSA